MFRQPARRDLYWFDRDLRRDDNPALAAVNARAGERLCAECDAAGPAESADAAVAGAAGSVR